MAHFVLHAHILRSSLSRAISETNRLRDYIAMQRRLAVVADDGGTRHATNAAVRH
ncbi:MAG: hypothetical protein V3U84_10165 [Thiotrichaceae bacterium]